METLTFEKRNFDSDAQRKHDDREEERKRIEWSKAKQKNEKESNEYLVAPIPERGTPIHKTGLHYGHGTSDDVTRPNPSIGRGQERVTDILEFDNEGHANKHDNKGLRERPLIGSKNKRETSMNWDPTSKQKRLLIKKELSELKEGINKGLGEEVDNQKLEYPIYSEERENYELQRGSDNDQNNSRDNMDEYKLRVKNENSDRAMKEDMEYKKIREDSLKRSPSLTEIKEEKDASKYKYPPGGGKSYGKGNVRYFK
ncbi:MAG: hypothetical protein ACD_58C00167G0007 [uncultured bacterium]|nr:MAG: hypothetical protein ACD_58C00167G0007 [uncultured bacterium]